MTVHRTITISDFQYVNGRMQCIGTRSKTKTFEPKECSARPIESYWLKDAAIDYTVLVDEMQRTGIVSQSDNSWQLVLDSSPQKYLRAFYNVCYRAKCLPFMSAREKMEAFNTSYGTQLKYYRAFNGKGECDSLEQEIINRLSVFRTFFSETNDKSNTKH